MGRATAPVLVTQAQSQRLLAREREFAGNGQHRWADRCRVVRMASERVAPTVIARLVKRPLRTVQGWLKAWRSTGLASLEPHTSTRGRRRKLDEHERLLLAKAISRGPRKAGYPGGVWTSPIIADYIQKRWNVTYHPGHVRRLLNELGFSIQFPRRKLALADKDAQAKWLSEDLPRIKKKPAAKAPSSSSKTK